MRALPGARLSADARGFFGIQRKLSTLLPLFVPLVIASLASDRRAIPAASGVSSRTKSAPSAVTAERAPNDASKLIDEIQGVYERRFQNSDVSGRTFESENILEIVRVTSEGIYFRTHLSFYNGHICALSGVATYREEAFVFRDSSAMSKCVFLIKRTDNALELEDPDGSCRAFYCGMHGGFVGAKFALKNRRPIRYLSRLKNSREYADAVKTFEAK